jgi:hypothetical protein
MIQERSTWVLGWGKSIVEIQGVKCQQRDENVTTRTRVDRRNNKEVTIRNA